MAQTQAPGGPQSSLKILFLTNRLWQRGWNWSRDLGTLKNTVFRPFWVPKKVQKNFTLFKNSLFSAVSSLGTHSIVFPMPKRHPPMPWSIPRTVWRLSFNRFFSPAKISLWKNLSNFLGLSFFRPWEHYQCVLWKSLVRLAATRASEMVLGSRSKGGYLPI